MSIWHLLVLAVLAVGYIWPVTIILKRMGYSPWWALLSVFTPLNMIGLWVLARARWPRVEEKF